MSYLSELDATGWQQRNTEDLLNQNVPDAKPGFLQGAVKGPVTGLFRGLTNLNDALLTATDLIVPMSDAERGQQEHIRHSLTDFFTPDARTVGTAGRVLGGVTEGVAPLLIPQVGVPLMVGSNTLATGKRAVDQGVDIKTAGEMAAIEGAVSAAGVKLPIVGSTLAQRLVTGAAGNLALGAGSAEAQHELLNRRGYEELAKNYDPLDGEARAVDLIAGLVFGGVHHLTLPSERAAVATVNNAKHYQQDTAPGVPVGPEASAAHQRAMDTATEQVIRGEPVNVPESVTRATFEPRPDAGNPIPEDLQQLDADQQALIDKSAAQGDAGGYDVAEGELTDEQLAAFQGLRSDVPADQNAGGVGGGAPGNERPSDAGGPGAGTGKPLEVFRGADRPLSAEHFEEEALGQASGNPSSGLGVFFTNDHADASRYGPLVERAHLDIRNPKVIKIEDFPAFDTLKEATAFRKQLQDAGHDGIVIDISHLGGPTQYVAFKHEQVLKPKPTAKPKAAPAAKQKPAERAATAEQSAAVDDPATAAVRESLAASDVNVPTGEIDAQGNAVTRSARELLAEADAGVHEAESLGQGIAAAVSCFITRGA